MRRLAALASMLAIPAAVLAAGQPRDPDTYFFNETFGNFHEELAEAKARGKLGVMLFFEEDDCPFCFRMRETIINQPEVQDWYRDRFLLFPVDVEGDTEMVDFDGTPMLTKDFAVLKNRVRATPVIIFYDLDGRQVVRHTGATSSVDEFMLLGRFVAEGHYREGNFTRFKRQQQKATD